MATPWGFTIFGCTSPNCQLEAETRRRTQPGARLNASCFGLATPLSGAAKDGRIELMTKSKNHDCACYHGIFFAPGVALAQSNAPTAPTSANPTPNNPVSTNGAPLQSGSMSSGAMKCRRLDGDGHWHWRQGYSDRGTFGRLGRQKLVNEQFPRPGSHRGGADFLTVPILRGG